MIKVKQRTTYTPIKVQFVSVVTFIHSFIHPFIRLFNIKSSYENRAIERIISKSNVMLLLDHTVNVKKDYMFCKGNQIILDEVVVFSILEI